MKGALCPACGAEDLQVWWLESPTMDATLRYWPHRRPHGPGECRNSNKPVQVTRAFYNALLNLPRVDESVLGTDPGRSVPT